MTKTKKQLRAEAVERLRNHDDDSIIQEVDSTIELLSDEVDSREKLEAEMAEYLERDWYMLAPGLLEKMSGWLNRQAAITAHQWESYHNGMMREWIAKTEELQAQVDELTAERDKWKAKAESILNAESYKFSSETDAERYTDCEKVEDDTRKKIEADVREASELFALRPDAYGDFVGIVTALLDRQEAITEREWESEQAYINEGYKEQIAELTAERDLYREKLSRALDLAHEIERLMP